MPTPVRKLLRPLADTAMGMYFRARRAHGQLRVALVVSELHFTGDAISNDLLGMYRELKRNDINVHIFVSVPVHAPGLPILACSARLAGYDLIIYHYSVYQPNVVRFVRFAKRFVLKYHNITPSYFFRGYTADY